MTTKTSKKDDRWTPRRKGSLYCSPACGRGCTFAAFEDATAKAVKLAGELGPDWQPRVWENLGWHSSAIWEEAESIGSCEVYDHSFSGSASCWIDLKIAGRGQVTKTVGRDQVLQGLRDLLRDVQDEAEKSARNAKLVAKALKTP